MKTKLVVPFALFLLFLLTNLICFSATANDSLILYKEVISGKIKLDSLAPQQQQEVLEIHTAVSRNSCVGCSDDCRDAKSQANNYRSDLEGYTKRLYRCVEDNDLKEDCDSEFRRVKNVHSDFESAISRVRSYCD
jgi:hypothetical protein